MLTLIILRVAIKINGNYSQHQIFYSSYEENIKSDYYILSDLIVYEDDEYRLYMSDIVKRFEQIENSNNSYKDIVMFNPPVDSNLNECYGYFIINNNNSVISVDGKNMCQLTNH